MKMSIAAGLLLFASTTLALADGHRSPAPDGARSYIVSPEDGATVSNPVTIVFGLEGMGVAPAGHDQENTGHHHLLINTTIDDVSLDETLPATDEIVHFGGGQTQVTKELPAGTHTLRILLGDYAHVPHDPPIVSEPITITVN